MTSFTFDRIDATQRSMLAGTFFLWCNHFRDLIGVVDLHLDWFGLAAGSEAGSGAHFVIGEDVEDDR